MTATDILATIVETSALNRLGLLPKLPEAVTRAVGRDPFPKVADGTLEQFTRIPIYLDPDVPAGILEFRHADGRIERVAIPDGVVPAITPSLGESWFGNRPGDPM